MVWPAKVRKRASVVRDWERLRTRRFAMMIWSMWSTLVDWECCRGKEFGVKENQLVGGHLENARENWDYGEGWGGCVEKDGERGTWGRWVPVVV